MNNTKRWFQLSRIAFMAGALVITASLLAQGNSQEHKTKFGKGANHPLKGKLNGNDPLSKDDTGAKNTPTVEEKKPKNTPGDGNGGNNTKEKEFNNDPAVKKEKDGPNGNARAKGQSGQHGNPGKGN